MTWTSAVGRSCKWLLYRIVHGLALTKISPNALTFIGLLINIVAGISVRLCQRREPAAHVPLRGTGHHRRRHL